MTTNIEQLSYHLASLFFFLIFLFIASRLSRSKINRTVRNIAIITSSFLMIVGLYTFLRIEHSLSSLGLIVIISAIFIGRDRKKNV